MSKAILVKKIPRSAIWFLKYLFRKLGVGITSYANLVSLLEERSLKMLQDLEFAQCRYDLEFVRALGPANYELTISLLGKSKSQLRQDLFVLTECKKKIRDTSLNLGRQMESMVLIPTYSKQNFLGQAYSLNRPECGRKI